MSDTKILRCLEPKKMRKYRPPNLACQIQKLLGQKKCENFAEILTLTAFIGWSTRCVGITIAPELLGVFFCLHCLFSSCCLLSLAYCLSRSPAAFFVIHSHSTETFLFYYYYYIYSYIFTPTPQTLSPNRVRHWGILLHIFYISSITNTIISLLYI